MPSIRRITAHQVDLPLHEGSYKWSRGKSVEVFDSTVVAVETDDGRVGHGEVCPLGPAYLPSYAAGARAGIAEIAPQLLGADPTALDQLNRRMDAALTGHPYVKTAIDMAAGTCSARLSACRCASSSVGALDACRAALHLDRFQQLRHRVQRRGRAATRSRADGRVDRARPRHPAAGRGAWEARCRGLLTVFE